MAGEPSESKNLQPPPSVAAKIEYPPGYRFMPTDTELIMEYLLKKLKNQPIPIAQIEETYLRLVNPMELTEEFPKLGDNEWYFFTPLDRKYPNGIRPDRSSESGYWKATGTDRKVVFRGEVVGFRRALVFYQGKPPKGHKTDWIMHEFRVKGSEHEKTSPTDMRLYDWVLCRLYQKSSSDDGNGNGDADADADADADEESRRVMMSSDEAAPVVNEYEHLLVPEIQHPYDYLDLTNIDWYEDLGPPASDSSIYDHEDWMMDPVEQENEEGAGNKHPNAGSFEASTSNSCPPNNTNYM